MFRSLLSTLPRARGVLGTALIPLLTACASDELEPPPLTSTGDTEAEQEDPLPGGDDCQPNWYDIDGPPVALGLDDPEGLDGSLAEHRSQIEFTAPARAPIAYPPPAPIDPAFARLSFEEFAARYADPLGKDWLVEGDQGMSDAGLHALYEYLHPAPTPTAPDGQIPAASTYAVGNFDAAWSSKQKLALTWCLGWVMPSITDFPDEHEENVTRALETMEWATRAWERAGDVNFVHLTEYDDPEKQYSGACQPGQNGIHFRVRTGPECLAGCGGLTFPEAIPYNEFLDPEQIDGTKEIVLGRARYFTNDTEARINALHELGHVMGFTHEHLQWLDAQDPNNSACTGLKSIPWRGLTPHDPDSVMAIDSCVGVNNNVPQLSPWDRLGAYYAYTWGHRRALMMSAVSLVDEYAYDGAGRAGIFWQKSQSPELEIWTSTGDPGAAIEFSSEALCADGTTPPCVGAFDVEGRVRPVNAALLGSDSDLDVLFHGPGPALADSLLVDDGLVRGPWDLDLDGFAVPVVGSFGPGNTDQVFLYRPGPEEGALLTLDESGVTVSPMNYTGYAYPLAGRYRGFEGGGNDILWYDPQNDVFSIWQWLADDPYNFMATAPTDTSSLGLDAAVEYVPLVADFNGDERTDVFWYSAGPGSDIMWWSTSDQDQVTFAAAGTQVNQDYRPFVGDFDGNGAADILWFAPYAEVAKIRSKIWYFSEDEVFETRTLSTRRDYSPYVADFDNDGCSDILWFKPDDPERSSPLWRCLPNQRDFECEPPVTTPAGAYPVGFGGAY